MPIHSRASRALQLTMAATATLTTMIIPGPNVYINNLAKLVFVISAQCTCATRRSSTIRGDDVTQSQSAQVGRAHRAGDRLSVTTMHCSSSFTKPAIKTANERSTK